MRTHRQADREALPREPRLYHTDDDLQRARLDEESADGLVSAYADVDDALEGERVEVGGVQCWHGRREAVYRRGIFRRRGADTEVAQGPGEPAIAGQDHADAQRS